jgi:hypothetical protein
MADGDHSPIPVSVLFPAAHAPASAYLRSESIGCSGAAEIALAFRIVASLLPLWRIDAVEPDSGLFPSNGKCVAIYHIS